MTMNGRIRNCLQLAKEIAMRSTMTNRHGAVLFSGDTVWSLKSNEPCTKLYRHKPTPSLHAETNCLYSMESILYKQRKCKKKLQLLVVRVDKNGNLLQSMPCSHCCLHLKKQNVETIYFSCSNSLLCKIDIDSLLPRQSSGWRGFHRK